HAQGTVIFANKTTMPVTITKGTVVRTSSGENVRFYTVADAWLPGELFATVRVGILAAEPGPKGNVPPLSITVIEGELAAQADVLNDARTSGGTVRRMPVVAGEDQVNLRAKLMKRLQEEAYKELTAALNKGEFIPPDSLTITIISEEFDHKVGDMADELGMSMKVRVTGLAIDTTNGEKLLLRLLEQRMKPGYRLLEDSATFQQDGLVEATPEKARFRMSVKAKIAPAIEAKDVSHAIAGQTVEAAKEYLVQQFKLSTAPQIHLQNSLLQRLPWWTARIHVRVSVR
ncbi:MAG: baseplate J/gp47 family protein, partial [Chloroflexi bacterium]|nr:baseplate J/gp47 family protein [Chloroflexota bacterium]